MNGRAGIAALVALFTVACGGGASTPASPATPADHFIVIAWAEPAERNVGAASTTYSGYCQLQNMDLQAQGYGDPSAAVVRLNGVQLHSDPSLKWYFRAPDIGALGAGDTVTLTIEYPPLGAIVQASDTVPQSVQDFTIAGDPFPPQGVANTSTSYSMSWTGVPEANEYIAWVETYDTAGDLAGVGSPTTGTSFDVPASELTLRDGTPAPWVVLSLSTVRHTDFPRFYAHSAFEVIGTNVVSKTNR